MAEVFDGNIILHSFENLFYYYFMDYIQLTSLDSKYSIALMQ